MRSTGQAETPMSDHVARFWHYLQTETVRILLDLKRTVGTDAPDGPVVYWDGSSFSNDVAKALVADRERLTADNEKLRALLREMPVKHPQQAARRDELLAAYQQLTPQKEE